LWAFRRRETAAAVTTTRAGMCGMSMRAAAKPAREIEPGRCGK
jgi:hypothetical protein